MAPRKNGAPAEIAKPYVFKYKGRESGSRKRDMTYGVGCSALPATATQFDVFVGRLGKLWLLAPKREVAR